MEYLKSSKIVKNNLGILKKVGVQKEKCKRAGRNIPTHFIVKQQKGQRKLFKAQ